LDPARPLLGKDGATCASLPASASGGGTLNRDGGAGGGEGEVGGITTGAETVELGSGRPPRLGGGGAGGAPRLEVDEVVLPVF
jgi:hypothetical protein